MSIQRKPYLGSLLPLVYQGKVRDTYAIPGYENLLLIVATDAVSTHNVAHKSIVPYKGEVLTAMTHFWTNTLGFFPSHIMHTGKNIYKYLHACEYSKDLYLRAMVVRKLDMIPVEFILRTRMMGSFWKTYSVGKSNPYGLVLPEGLQLMSQFDSPIFTPIDKSETDEPLRAMKVVSRYEEAVNLAFDLYEKGGQYAKERGIEVIDAKFELGYVKHNLFFGDEFLTPDCCRFVEADKIVVGQELPWMDTEILRQEAMKQWGDGPRLPLEFSPDVVDMASIAYLATFQRLVGVPLSQYQREYFC